jgi:hypothetical protein
MKNYSQTLVFLLLADLIHLATSIGRSESMAAAAITEIANKLSEKEISFDFIVYRCELDHLVDKIAKSVDKPVNVIKVRNSKEFRVCQSAIVFVDHEELEVFHSHIVLGNDFPQDFHFFIYMATFKGELKQIKSKEFIDSTRLHRFCYYLLDHKDSIELVTYTTFQQPKCREVNQVTINRFSKVTKKWETDKFTIEKFRNFNGCELVVLKATYEDDIYVQLHEIFQRSFNFSAKYVISDNSQKFVNKEVPNDFAIIFFPKRVIVIKENRVVKFKLAFTHHAIIANTMLIVSRFLPYSMLDKALMPFDPEVWCWLIGFLAFGVVFIIVVTFMREKVKKFVFGSRVRAPLLNMV